MRVIQHGVYEIEVVWDPRVSIVYRSGPSQLPSQQYSTQVFPVCAAVVLLLWWSMQCSLLLLQLPLRSKWALMEVEHIPLLMPFPWHIFNLIDVIFLIVAAVWAVARWVFILLIWCSIILGSPISLTLRFSWLLKLRLVFRLWLSICYTTPILVYCLSSSAIQSAYLLRSPLPAAFMRASLFLIAHLFTSVRHPTAYFYQAPPQPATILFPSVVILWGILIISSTLCAHLSPTSPWIIPCHSGNFSMISPSTLVLIAHSASSSTIKSISIDTPLGLTCLTLQLYLPLPYLTSTSYPFPISASSMILMPCRSAKRLFFTALWSIATWTLTSTHTIFAAAPPDCFDCFLCLNLQAMTFFPG